jgi:hypothetical protein
MTALSVLVLRFVFGPPGPHRVIQGIRRRRMASQAAPPTLTRIGGIAPTQPRPGRRCLVACPSVSGSLPLYRLVSMEREPRQMSVEGRTLAAEVGPAVGWLLAHREGVPPVLARRGSRLARARRDRRLAVGAGSVCRLVRRAVVSVIVLAGRTPRGFRIRGSAGRRARVGGRCLMGRGRAW